MKIMLRILIVFALGFSNVYFDNGDQDDELPPPLPTETSAPVGRIPASFEVAANGAATYTIPIQALPGRQGVQPDLALVYNSMGGSGFLGIRWSLSGLSMITRTGSSYAQDGHLDQVEYDPEDHFNLDGQRLVVIEGDYGENNTEYRTRNDVFARIICHVTPGGEDKGPEYFTVYTKDGLILTYGQNGAEGMTTVLLGRDGVRRAWALSKIEDRMGNYMLFYYLRDANSFPEDRDGDGIASETLGPAEREMTEMAPSIILYTGNSTTGDRPQRWVKFTYEDHSSPRYGYSGGIRLSQTRLLTKIRVGIGSLVGGDNDINMVRKYELDYHKPPLGAFSEQPYLISVTEKDKDNVAKPPTLFEWIAGARGFSARLTTEHRAPRIQENIHDTDDWIYFNMWIPIDVNNDGYTDLMYPSAEDRGVSTWRILLNGGQGYYAEHRAYFVAEIDTGVESDEPLGTTWGSQTPYPLGRVMDYNQDGYMDLLLGDGSRTWQVLLNSRSNAEPFFERRPFDTGIPVIEPSAGSYFTYTTEQDFIRFKAFYTYLVDVNADGMRDLIWCEVIGSERDAEHMHRLWKYRLHTGEGFGEEHAITQTDRDRVKNPVRPLFLDYDGDGATDLLIYYGRADGNYTRFSFVDGGPPLSYFSTNLPVFHTQMFFDFSGSVYGERIGPVFAMDINGDGLKDVLYVKTVMGLESLDDGRWYNDFREPRMWINTGKGFIGGRDGLSAFSYPCIDYDEYNFYQATVLDYNLDGRDDLIVANKRYDTPENRGRAWQAIKFDVIEAANISTFDGSECGFDLAAVIYPPDPVVTGYNNYNTPTIVDVNGDFLPDMVGIENDRFFVSVMTGEMPYVITKIRDGMIGITEEHRDWKETWTVSVEYEPTTNAEVYQDEYPDELPDGVTVPDPVEGALRNRPAMNVVSSYALDNDIGQAPFAYRLAYYDSRYDRYWGWLGFGQLQVVEELTGIRTTTAFDNFTQEDRLMVRHCPFGYYPYQGMVAHSWTEAALEDGSSNLTVRHNFYAHQEPGNKRYFAYLKSSEARVDYFPDGVTSQRLSTSVYVVDRVNGYGDITQASLQSGNAGEVNELAFYADYDNDASQWLIGRPQSYSFSWTLPDGSTWIQRWQLDYLADTRLVETFTRSPHNDRYKQELVYDYDDYGNVVESEMQALDADGALQTKHHTLITYDSGEHIFPAVVESPYGLTARYQFSPQGWLQVIEGYNGEITRLGYDGFDRLVCAEHPTGYVETVDFQVLTFGDELGNAFRGHSRLRVQIKDNTGGETTLSYDRLGRVFHAGTNGFDGARINSRIFYNDYGLVDMIHLPRLVGSGENPYIEYAYDILRRVTSTKDSEGATTTAQYGGLEVMTTDANDHTTTYTYNSLGQLVAVQDALEGVVSYQYGAFGVLKKIVDPLGGEISYGFDVYGRITSSRYPSAGRSSRYRYDSFDNLVWMENASGKESTFEYDLLNRLEKVTDVDITTEYHYDDSTANALGRLYRVTVSGAWDNEEQYSYNGQGLLSRMETQIDGEDFVHRFEYDDYGRLSVHHYPDGPDYITYRGSMTLLGRKRFALRYHYNAEGYLASTSNSSSGIVYWTANEMDAAGHVTRETYGNRIETRKSFNPLTGDLESVTSAVQDLVFQYYPNGNLMTREDVLGRMSETLVYDELDRLRTSTIAVSGARTTIEYDYDAVGNLLFRSDVGDYVYDDAARQPYALRRIETTGGGVEEYSYDNEGNRTRSPAQTVKYTAFNKPKEVTALSSGENIFYEYDGDLNRVVERHSEGTTVYVDGFTRYTDASGNKIYQYHIGNAVVGIRTVPPKFGGIEEIVLYRHFDHLGSVYKLTDDTGSERDTLYFDAFGQSRADSWIGHIEPVSDAGIFYGFTGHEHDQDFDLNLINMGGRIYDPQIGQFLSPDPIIQTLTFSQNYGPYNYAFNNPLTFIDPTGYEVGGGDTSGGGWEPSVWATMNFSPSRTREAFHPAPAPQWDASTDTFALLSRTGGPELVSAQSGGASPVAPPDNFESLFTPRPFTETGFAGSPSRVVRISPERQEEGLLDISILALTQGLLPVATSAASTTWRWLGGRLSSAWSSFIIRTPFRGYASRYWANLADDLAIYEGEGAHQVVVGATSELQLATARALGSAAPQELLAADLSGASKVTVVAHAPGSVGYIRGVEHHFPAIPGRITVGGRAYTGRQLANILRQRGFRGSQIDLYVCGAASTGLQQEVALSMRGVAVRAPYGIAKLREPLGAPARVGVQWSTARTGPVVLDESMWSMIRY